MAERIRAMARHSMTKFALVGLLGFATDIGLLWLLHGILGMWLWLATTIAYLVAFALSFVLSREWVFPDAGNMRTQIIRYAVLVAGILVMTVLGVQALVWFAVSYLLAKLATSCVVAVVNYGASRWWVFRTGAPAPVAPVE
jgi:putative flippase GtrA